MRNFIIAALLLLLSSNSVAADAEVNNFFAVETEGSYRMEVRAASNLAKEVALYNAKRKAVDIAGRYLSRKGLIKSYELNKDEIYSLTAREIQAEILDEKQELAGKTSTYRLRIKCKLHPFDFVKAEIEDSKQVKEEENESYQEEMEQPISAEIDPGRDIAKAYRLLREKKWRITIIYLNHLEEKYPNWDSIYMAKAITYYILHEPVFMKNALNRACQLGNNTACDDLQNIAELHEHDFGLQIID